jgi:hypothetical protein
MNAASREKPMAEFWTPAELRPAFALSETNPPMLTFEQPNGDSVSLHYSGLGYLRYDPAGALRLRFPDTTVVV